MFFDYFLALFEKNVFLLGVISDFIVVSMAATAQQHSLEEDITSSLVVRPTGYGYKMKGEYGFSISYIKSRANYFELTKRPSDRLLPCISPLDTCFLIGF